MTNQKLQTILEKILAYPNDKFNSNAFSPEEIKTGLKEDFDQIVDANKMIETEEDQEIIEEFEFYEGLIEKGECLDFPFMI